MDLRIEIVKEDSEENEAWLIDRKDVDEFLWERVKDGDEISFTLREADLRDGDAKIWR